MIAGPPKDAFEYCRTWTTLHDIFLVFAFLLPDFYTHIKPPGFGHLILVGRMPCPRVSVVGAVTNPMQTGTKLCHHDTLFACHLLCFLQFSFSFFYQKQRHRLVEGQNTNQECSFQRLQLCSSQHALFQWRDVFFILSDRTRLRLGYDSRRHTELCN